MPRVRITYCTGCRWLLRAAWMAQELLSTFEQELSEVALAPGEGGVYQIRVETADASKLVWDRATEGGFPEIKLLKQRVRDEIAPEKDLGHAEKVSE